MSDVAQILGGTGSKQPNTTKTAGPAKPPPPLPPGHHPSRAMQMTAMPKEVMELVGGTNQDPKSAALPPIVPTFSGASIPTAAATVKVGNKWIKTQKPARKWVWAPFASSARTDGLLLNHWVRHGIDYPDYPYAKFDIHLDPVTYSGEEEYRSKLQHESWTKSETDQLLELARKLDLRWAVIYDRWLEIYQHNPEEEKEEARPPMAATRKIEDLQHRYYSVAAILMQHRIAQEAAAEAQALARSVPDPSTDNPKAAADALLRDTTAARTVAAGDPKNQPLLHNVGTGSTNKIFDLTYEKERRAHLEAVWHRTKEEEEEEAQLRKELRLVDVQIRKLKKTGGHIIAAKGGTASGLAAAASAASLPSSREASRSASPANPADSGLDQSFASTAPTPMAGTPYLQSGRLVPPASGGATGLNKTLLNRMDAVLAELKIKPRPIPTKRVCDVYDSVRKDILTLLTLQKMVLQKEGQLQSKRVKLSKMGGKIHVADEETALGIPKPQPPPPPIPTTPATSSASAAAAAAAAAAATVKPKAPRTGGKGKTATAAASGKGKGTVKAAKATPASTAVAVQAADAAKTKAIAAKPGDVKAKAAAAAVVKPAAAGGKQTSAAKQATGKQARKPAAKRKRKSQVEAKSPAAAATSAAATQAAAQAAAGYVPPTTAPSPTAARPAPVPAPAAVPPAPVPASVPPTAATPAAAAAAPVDSKPAAKKRARKS